MCTGAHKRTSDTFRSMEGISCYLIFAYLDFIKYNETYIHFYFAQKHENYRIWCANSIHNLFTGQHKIIRTHEQLSVEIVESSFLVIEFLRTYIALNVIKLTYIFVMFKNM